MAKLVCPDCGATLMMFFDGNAEIDSDTLEVSLPTVSYRVECLDCGYELTDIADVVRTNAISFGKNRR